MFLTLSSIFLFFSIDLFHHISPPPPPILKTNQIFKHFMNIHWDTMKITESVCYKEHLIY